MVAGTPVAVTLTCPRCKFTKAGFVNVDGGTIFRCSRCEWQFTLTAVAPTGTGTLALTAGVSTAITVASGGASFTSGMFLLYDTSVNAEVLQVSGTATGTSIPLARAVIKSHGTNTTFGQLAVSPSFGGFGEQAIPVAPGYGF